MNASAQEVVQRDDSSEFVRAPLTRVFDREYESHPISVDKEITFGASAINSTKCRNW